MPKSKNESGKKPETKNTYFCIVIIPAYGDVDIKKYSNYDEGRKALHDIHKLKFLGKFDGDVVSFIGEFVRVTDVGPSIYIDDPVRGKLELKDEDSFGEARV